MDRPARWLMRRRRRRRRSPGDRFARKWNNYNFETYIKNARKLNALHNEPLNSVFTSNRTEKCFPEYSFDRRQARTIQRYFILQYSCTQRDRCTVSGRCERGPFIPGISRLLLGKKKLSNRHLFPLDRIYGRP